MKILVDTNDSSVVSFEKRWTDFRLFAIRRHKDQKYGCWPYSYHLAMVENYLDEFGFSSNEYRAGAWLHDTVEDTETTLDEISHFYGPRIAALVWACTGEGADRKEKNQSIYKKLAQFPDAAPIKVADRFANITNSINEKEGCLKKAKMYVDEWPEFAKNVQPLMETNSQRLCLWNELCDVVEKAKKALKA